MKKKEQSKLQEFERRMETLAQEINEYCTQIYKDGREADFGISLSIGGMDENGEEIKCLGRSFGRLGTVSAVIAASLGDSENIRTLAFAHLIRILGFERIAFNLACAKEIVSKLPNEAKDNEKLS